MKRFRLLVTRDLSEASQAFAHAHGIETATYAFIRIDYADRDTLSPTLEKYADSQCHAAFTSRHAAAAVAPVLNDIKIDQWRIYCLEGATRREVKKYFADRQIAAMAPDAAALATRIIELNETKRLLFFCGNKRRDELPMALAQQGIEVEECQVYTTVLSPKKIEGQFDGAAFFSPSAVESFFLVNELPGETVCFAIGNTTAAALHNLGRQNIVIASGVSEQHLLSAVAGFADRD